MCFVSYIYFYGFETNKEIKQTDCEVTYLKKIRFVRVKKSQNWLKWIQFVEAVTSTKVKFNRTEVEVHLRSSYPHVRTSGGEP